MKYLHVSKEFYTDKETGKLVFTHGKTMDVGRNAKKRELRKGLPKKQWPSLARGYGYS